MAIHLIFYLFKLSLGMSYYQEGHELLQFSQDVILNFFLQNQSIGGVKWASGRAFTGTGGVTVATELI